MSDLIKIQADYQANYTKVPNQVTRNPHLSGLAKAIFSYVLGCAPGWEISLKDIKRHFEADSMHAIRKAVGELVQAGMLKFENKRDEFNRFIGKVWKLIGGSESGVVSKPEPCAGSRDDGIPNHGEPTQYNKTLCSENSLSKTLHSPGPEKKEEEVKKEFKKPVGKLAELQERVKRLARMSQSPEHQERLKKHEEAEARLEQFKPTSEPAHQFDEFKALGISAALEKLAAPFAGKANAYYLKKMKSFFTDDHLIAPLVETFNLSKDAKTLKYVVAVWNDKQAQHGRIHV